MSFFYKQYQMLEIFDSEKIIDKEAKISIFCLHKNNFYLEVYLSPYDGDIALSLSHKDSDRLLFDISSSSIVKMSIDKNIPRETRLIFYKENKDQPVLILLIDPAISLNCNF